VGTNLRFLITNLTGRASQVFAFYNDRGECEKAQRAGIQVHVIDAISEGQLGTIRAGTNLGQLAEATGGEAYFQGLKHTHHDYLPNRLQTLQESGAAQFTTSFRLHGLQIVNQCNYPTGEKERSTHEFDGEQPGRFRKKAVLQFCVPRAECWLPLVAVMA
jgi:hypothetical protein